MELLEIESCRAGLGAKFSIWCINSQCSINESFYSKNKTNRVFDVNKKSVRTYWVFKILQYFAVSPIVKFKFVEHVKYLEEKAFELRNENFKMAATRARNLIIKENNLDPSFENVDIPTIFDGTWCSRGRTVNRAFVTAIAEKTAQVIDFSYRYKTCVQCSLIEERKNNGLSTIDYLDQIIEHNSKCFKNHYGSPQVYFTLFSRNF